MDSKSVRSFACFTAGLIADWLKQVQDETVAMGWRSLWIPVFQVFTERSRGFDVKLTLIPLC